MFPFLARNLQESHSWFNGFPGSTDSLVPRIHCYCSPFRKYEDGIPGSKIHGLDGCSVVVN